jgi:hypothetical protein
MLPNRPLLGEDIINYVTKFKISHFRGVFARDDLPRKPNEIECGVLNLAKLSEHGSHWTAYYKNKNEVNYFDSFGDLAPPIEIQKYFKKCNILYNYSNYQDFDSFMCGHLCLKFLLCMNQLV